MRGEFQEYLNCGACKECVEYILFECEHVIFENLQNFFGLFEASFSPEAFKSFFRVAFR